MKTKKTTGKTGRPKKKDALKGVYRNVRFTPDEDAALAEKVKVYGGTRSDFIREAIAGAKVVAVPTPETIKLFQEYLTNLRNIGTNLNAIAHRANIEEVKFGYLEMREAKNECDALLQICKDMQAKMMK